MFLLPLIGHSKALAFVSSDAVMELVSCSCRRAVISVFNVCSIQFSLGVEVSLIVVGAFVFTKLLIR